MRNATKIVVIIVVIIVGVILMGINMSTRKSNGFVTPGPLGTILFIGIIAAIGGVLKYKPEEPKKEDSSADHHKLDKS